MQCSAHTAFSVQWLQWSVAGRARGSLDNGGVQGGVSGGDNCATKYQQLLRHFIGLCHGTESFVKGGNTIVKRAK